MLLFHAGKIPSVNKPPVILLLVSQSLHVKIV